MGRGRQKAKQTKMARKLKYMTTDTDYNELEKELSSQEVEETEKDDRQEDSISQIDKNSLREDDTTPDLDDYAAWAAEAAKKAESQAAKKPVPHKPFPKIPMPSALKPKPKSKPKQD